MLPSKCRIPLCTYCDKLVWRTATAKLDSPSSNIHAGQVFPLWPDPASKYAILSSDSGVAPGIAFCPSCAPKIGEPALDGYGPILGYETALNRYCAWYAPERELFYRTWLQDALYL